MTRPNNIASIMDDVERALVEVGRAMRSRDGWDRMRTQTGNELDDLLHDADCEGAELYNEPILWAMRQGVTLQTRPWSNSERFHARLGARVVTGNHARTTLAKLKAKVIGRAVDIAVNNPAAIDVLP